MNNNNNKSHLKLGIVRQKNKNMNNKQFFSKYIILNNIKKHFTQKFSYVLFYQYTIKGEFLYSQKSVKNLHTLKMMIK